MSQEDLKVHFRSMELQRRSVRRKQLMNEMALEGEPPSPEEEAAIESLRRQEMVYHQDVFAPPFPSRGYWRRLWGALLAR